MRRRSVIAASLLMAPPVKGQITAQAWAPNRPVRWIVGFAAGSFGDTTARLIGQRLSESLGQPVVVENRPSAGGITASEIVARAAPDGHTLLLVTASAATAPHLFRTLPFHPIDDFTFVAQIASFPHLIVTAANGPHRSLSGLIEAARAAPDRVNLGSVSAGTALHLSLELFRSMARIPAEIVTYRSVGELLNAAATGEVDAAMEVAATALGQVSGGQLRALAVTSPQRIALLPDVPTVAESGVPAYNVRTWNGMAAPGGTPRSAVDRLNAEIRRILEMPDIRDRLAQLAVEPAAGTPEALRDLLVAETELWGRVIRAAGIERQ